MAKLGGAHSPELALRPLPSAVDARRLRGSAAPPPTHRLLFRALEPLKASVLHLQRTNEQACLPAAWSRRRACAEMPRHVKSQRSGVDGDHDDRGPRTKRTRTAKSTAGSPVSPDAVSVRRAAVRGGAPVSRRRLPRHALAPPRVRAATALRQAPRRRGCDARGLGASSSGPLARARARALHVARRPLEPPLLPRRPALRAARPSAARATT